MSTFYSIVFIIIFIRTGENLSDAKTNKETHFRAAVNLGVSVAYAFSVTHVAVLGVCCDLDVYCIRDVCCFRVIYRVLGACCFRDYIVSLLPVVSATYIVSLVPVVSATYTVFLIPVVSATPA